MNGLLTELFDVIRREPDFKIEISKPSYISSAFRIRISMGDDHAECHIYERFDDEAMERDFVNYVKSMLNQLKEAKEEKEK